MRRFAIALLAAAGFAATAAHAQPGGPREPVLEPVADPACSALATPGTGLRVALISQSDPAPSL